jgi:hypothetical protein
MSAADVFPPDVSTGPMCDAEVAELGDWAKAEGWNPGHGDLAVARAFDPEAFVALRRGGEMIGGGSIIRYGESFGFMGLFILRADARGLGLGGAFWRWRLDRLRARLAPDAAIGMDGVYHMAPFYRRGGFVDAFRHLRLQGVARGASDPDAVREPAALLPDLCAFDRDVFPAARHAFLSAWIDRPGVRVSGIYGREGLRAYGVARPCAEGFKIGPFFARDAQAAERAFGDLLAGLSGEQVQIDIPEVNEQARALVDRHAMSEVFGCMRLYRGAPPECAAESIYGVTSLEFG